MYLFTQQQGTLSLTVLDENGAAVQTFPVLEDLEEEDRLSSVRLREGNLLAESARDRFRVVETAGGTCRAALEGSLRAVCEETLASGYYGEPALDYDGERLAYVGEMSEECACFLALYGPEGLEYLGTYALSLGREVNCGLYDPENSTPLTVRLPR